MRRHASLNHAYRLVWDLLRQMWVPVAETSRRRGKSGRVVLLGAGLLALAGTAAALPTGGQVSAGSGAISQSGGSMTISQQSQNLAVNWQDFGIGASESVTFQQPNSSAIALNRVLGQNATELLGQLNANGQVFILNPNGVLFGTGAQISVGGLVASTLNLSDSDLLAGNFAFSGSSSAAVSNAGTINAAQGGYVALIGASVENSGSITAPLGNVSLAAGQQVTLQLANGSLLGLTVDKGAMDALASNAGHIAANGGQVLLTAQAADQLARAVVNNTGVIEARSAENHNGVIRLLGDMQNSTVNVAGTLDASAPDGGNGGFVETSAAQVQVADGTRVSTLAADGTSGSWLIDPNDYTIAASGGDISGATLSSNLGLGNVLIESSSGGSAGNGDIHVNDAVSWSANTLTLTAARDVNINAVLTASGSAGLALNTATANGSDSAVSGGTVNVGLNSSGFSGRVDFTGGSNSLSINGTAYTILTSLGAEGSTTGTDLQGISGDLAGHYALGADIDASATSGWNSGAGFDPIGASSSFTGVFDGLGHSIDNLFINRSSRYIGLFANVNGASLRNVELANVDIRNGSTVGGLAGIIASSTVSNATVSGSISVSGSSMAIGGLVGRMTNTSISHSGSSATISGSSAVGGLVGQKGSGSITDSWASGSVTGTGNLAGGLVAISTGGSISGSWASGTVQGSTSVGGLVGSNGSASTITNSYATGNVISLGIGSSAGGLVGSNTGALTAVHATGTVSGASQVGGLVGINNGLSAVIVDAWASGDVSAGGQYAGGLVGRTTNASLTGVHATGAVTGRQYSGGLIGQASGTAIESAWASGAVSGTSQVGGLVGQALSSTAISASHATGNVTASGDDAGGLAGGLLGGSTVTDSWASGTVNGGNHVGGLVGSLYDGSVTGAVATGGASGASAVGGLIGEAYSTAIAESSATGAVTGTDRVGGLVGDNVTSTVDQTYASGVVSGSSNVGGLQGSSTGTVTASFFDTATTGQSASAGGTGLSTAALHDASTYSGWDIDLVGGGSNTWRMYDGHTGPLLKSILTTLALGDAATVYDGNATHNLDGGDFSIDPLLGIDTANILGSATATASSRNAGSYSGTDLAWSNDLYSTVYDIVFSGGTLTVDKAAITFSTGDVVKTYDGGTSAAGSAILASGAMIAGDTFSGGTFAFTDKNAGSGDKVVTVSGVTVNDGNGGNNYAITYADNSSSTITPAALVVTARDASRAVGAPDPAFTVSYAGFVDGEDKSVLDGTLSVVTDATSASDRGRYRLTPSGLSSSNYAIEYVDGVLEVTDMGPATPAGVTTAVLLGNSNAAGGSANTLLAVGNPASATDEDDDANAADQTSKRKTKHSRGNAVSLLRVEGAGIRLPPRR